MLKDKQIIVALIGFAGLIIAAFTTRPWDRDSKVDSRPEVYTKSEEKRPEATPKPEYGKIFDKDDPYPIGFKDVKIGIRLSVVRNLFPNGELSGLGYYSVNLEKSAFDRLLAHFDEQDKEVDPKIKALSYNYRDGAKDIIRKQALSSFGSDKVENRALGSIMYWPDINGCKVYVHQESITIVGIDTPSEERIQEHETKKETESK